MRKIMSLMLVVLLCVCLASTALAKDSFVPSIGYKDGPEIVDAEIKDEDVVPCLVVTSIPEAQAGTDEIHEDAVDLLLQVYDQLVDGSMELPLEGEYVIRELVDVSFTIECDEQDPHKEWLEEDGTTVDITFDLGVAPDETVTVMAYVDNKWVHVPTDNNGDGTVDCVFEDICPVVFCVGDVTPPAQTGDIAGQHLILWIVLMVVSFVAVVVLVVRRNKFVR